MTPIAPRADPACSHALWADPHQRALLQRLEQDRRTLVRASAELRGPLRALATAQHVLRIVRKSLRWVALAGTLTAIAAQLRKRGRPPPLLVLGAALQLLQLRRRPGLRPDNRNLRLDPHSRHG